MVRGNSITEAGTAGYEPYSEVMASLIAQVLGLPDYNAWEIVKRTNACLMEDPIGCDSARMKPLRTPRAAEPEGS